MGSPRYVFPVGVGLIAVAGVLLVLAATPYGAGVMPDSTVYLVGAENIARGNGFLAFHGSVGGLGPVMHYPPLFSALVGATSWLGMTVETAARLLNAALVGATAVLASITVRHLAPAATLPALLAAALVVAAPDILAAHTLALSEPLFISFSLMATIFLIRYTDKPTVNALAGAALATAAAGLTRYAGGAVMIAGACVILLLRERKLVGRIKDAAIFGVVAFLPSGLWALRNLAVSSELSDRALGFHPLGSEQWIGAASAVSKWSFIGRIDGSTGVALGTLGLAVLIAVFLYIAPRRKLVDGQSDLVIPLLIASYSAFLIFTAFVIDADTTMDSRSLLPIHLWAIVLAVAWASQRMGKMARPARIVVTLMACLLLVCYSVRSAVWLNEVRGDGQLYSSRSWRDSSTIAVLKRLNTDGPIFSNGSEAIYYLTRRTATDLPAKFDPHTGRSKADLDRTFDDIKRELAEHSVYVVYFNALSWKTFFPSEDELRSRLNLRLVASETDGNIYSVESR